MRRDRSNTFMAALAKGRWPTAMWVTIPWFGVPEVLGARGVDAAFIDLQHVSHGLDGAQPLILASEVAGVTPIVRAVGIDRGEATRILDAGAHGVIFPEVESADMAKAAVRTMLFPPRGLRGWGGAHTRYANWVGGMARQELLASQQQPFAVHNREFLEGAERDLVCILIVESVAGVENIEAIAAVPGVHGVVFGWGDYSVEVGFDVDRTKAASARVYQACRTAGIGVAVPYRGSGDEPHYPGCFSIVGVDSLLLDAAVTAAVRRDDG